MALLSRSALPNVITVARILLAPIVLVLLFVPTFSARFISWILFLIAAFSDLWDGYLARKHGWISDFGKLVDPIADKLLLAATFLPFYILSRRPDAEAALPVLGTFPLWILLVVFGREALVTVLRGVLAKRGTVVPAGRSGKLKAVFQNIFIGATIFWYALQSAAADHDWAGTAWELWQVFHAFVLLTTLAIAVVLTLFSLGVYLWQWRRLVREIA